jgi:hypothetical protein
LSIINQRESRKIDKRRACNFLHRHFLDWKADAWGGKANSSRWSNWVLPPLMLPLLHTLVYNLSIHYCFISISLSYFIMSIYKNQI